MKPWPRGPSRFVSGTRASSKVSGMGVGGVPAHLAVGRLDRVAGGAVRDDDVRDLEPAVVVLAGDGGDRDAAGDVGARVGDELLGAVDDPLVAVELGPGLGVAGIGSGFGFGQAEGGELLAGGQVGHPLVLLLVGAPVVDRGGAERDVGGHGDRHRRVDPGQLFHRECVGEDVAAAAAVLLGEGDAHQAEIAELLDDLVGEGLGAVQLFGDGRDLAHGEITDCLPEQALLVSQIKVHAPRSLCDRTAQTPPAARRPGDSSPV